jgi:hypothetical protein
MEKWFKAEEKDFLVNKCNLNKESILVIGTIEITVF